MFPLVLRTYVQAYGLLMETTSHVHIVSNEGNEKLDPSFAGKTIDHLIALINISFH